MKALPADIEAVGFTHMMFSQEPDWTAADGYLESLLEQVAAEVEARVGVALYDAAVDGVNHARLKKAEIELATAELWRRRSAAMSGQIAAARDDQSIAAQIREFKRTALEAESRAWELLALVNPDAVVTGSGGVAIGYVETGAFA